MIIPPIPQITNLDHGNSYGTRKTSTDPAASNKNDIFGNSYGLKMHQQSEIIIKSRQIMVEDHEEMKKGKGTPLRSKARGLLPMTDNKAYESNKQIYGD